MALVETTGLRIEPLKYSPRRLSRHPLQSQEPALVRKSSGLWGNGHGGSQASSIAVGTGPAPSRDILWPGREVRAWSTSGGHHGE